MFSVIFLLPIYYELMFIGMACCEVFTRGLVPYEAFSSKTQQQKQDFVRVLRVSVVFS